MTEITGYVGQILAPDEIESSSAHPVDQQLINDHVIAINQSPMPAQIDQVLRKLTAGRLGFSMELEDTTMVLVDETVAEAVEPGDQMAIDAAKKWDGCYRLIDGRDLTDV